MRARLAVAISGRRCSLREVVLRNKPQELLQASPKATVPVLVLPDGTVLEESLDIMLWALRGHDPEQWLVPEVGDLPAMLHLIHECDTRFKLRLDRYKYPGRFLDEFIQQSDAEVRTSACVETKGATPNDATGLPLHSDSVTADPRHGSASADSSSDTPGTASDTAAKAAQPHKAAAESASQVDEAALSEWALTQRDLGGQWLASLETRLEQGPWLFGSRRSLADMAIAPFVRQYAHVDKEWFDAQPWPALQDWLSAWLKSELFAGVMAKYPPWTPDMPGEPFP